MPPKAPAVAIESSLLGITRKTHTPTCAYCTTPISGTDAYCDSCKRRVMTINKPTMERLQPLQTRDLGPRRDEVEARPMLANDDGRQANILNDPASNRALFNIDTRAR